MTSQNLVAPAALFVALSNFNKWLSDYLARQSLAGLTWLNSSSASTPLFPHAKQLQDEAKLTLMDLSVEEDLLVREQHVIANKLKEEALEHLLTLVRDQAGGQERLLAGRPIFSSSPQQL